MLSDIMLNFIMLSLMALKSVSQNASRPNVFRPQDVARLISGELNPFYFLFLSPLPYTLICWLPPNGATTFSITTLSRVGLLVTLSIITLYRVPLWGVSVMLSVVSFSVLLNLSCAECLYDDCRYADCRYAECLHAECRGAPPIQYLQVFVNTMPTIGTGHLYVIVK